MFHFDNVTLAFHFPLITLASHWDRGEEEDFKGGKLMLLSMWTAEMIRRINLEESIVG